MTLSTELEGQTILITGAAGRLGSTLTDRILGMGASVIGADLQETDFADEAFRFHQTDCLDEHAVAALFRDIEERGEGLGAVIHTVGTWAGGPLHETSLDDFRRLIDLNLTSAFLCFREAVKHWKRVGQGGRLVAIASMQGAEGGVAQQAGYSAAKAGVIRLVESTNRELRDVGITAAAVAPSMILYGDEPEGTAGVSAKRVADLCAYLASDRGVDHQGTVIRVYGST